MSSFGEARASDFWASKNTLAAASSERRGSTTRSSLGSQTVVARATQPETRVRVSELTKVRNDHDR
jgi:hypothetical protein